MLDLLTFVASLGLQQDMEKVAEDRNGSTVETVEENHSSDNVADAAAVLSNACAAVENAVSGVLTVPSIDLRLPTAADRK